MNTKKEEVYEIIHEGPEFEMAIRLMPVRYIESDIVKVTIDGETRGYKMIPKPCRVDPKDFPIFVPDDDMYNDWVVEGAIMRWIEDTIKVNEADIDLKSYVKDDFSELKDQIYIHLCARDNIADNIPSKKFKVFKITYEIGFVIDGLYLTLPVDYNMAQRWGITLEKLDKVAMENSIRDYPPILKAGKDSGRGQDNLLLGDTPNKIDKYYMIINPDCYHSVSTLAYPGVLEKIAEILDDDFVFLAKNSNCVWVSPANREFDHWFISLEIKCPELVCNEDYFSPISFKYVRKTGEITRYI